MGAPVTAVLTQPVISCVTSSQMLLKPSELPCLLISCGSKEEVYFPGKKNTHTQKLWRNQNQTSSRPCRRAFNKQKYKYVKMGVVCSVWGYKTECRSMQLLPEPSAHSTLIRDFQSGHASVLEFLGYHVQTSSLFWQTTLWGVWRKY